jgi:hypothetical protein
MNRVVSDDDTSERFISLIHYHGRDFAARLRFGRRYAMWGWWRERKGIPNPTP